MSFLGPIFGLLLIMEGQFEKLKSLFISDPDAAITQSQKIICSVSNFKSYKDFITYHHQNSHISTCQREWSSPQISIHCFDCSIDPQSCVCLQCFLNGNHQGHDYFIYPDSTGNCDCGDLSLWKKSGFCHDHQGLSEDDHPELYLDEQLRNTLTDIIFKAAFSSLEQLQTDNEKKVSLIIQFISSFLKFGDGFRRLIAISLTEKIDFERLLGQIFECSFSYNQSLQQLCGGLINDQLFKVNFGRINFKLLIEKTIPEIIRTMITNSDDDNISMWNEFWFQSFSLQTMKTLIEDYNWDWVNFALQFSTYMKEFFNMPSVLSIESSVPSVLNEISCNMHYASQVQPNEQTQRLFDQLFSTVLNCGTDKEREGKSNNYNNTIISASFAEVQELNCYFPIQLFIILYYPFIQVFRNKANLKVDKLIEELDRTIDISTIFCINHNENGNENDLFVSGFVDEISDLSSIRKNKYSEVNVPIENYFKSFHNGGSFFFSFPLYDSLCSLFKLDNLNRVKIARLLVLDQYKKLRIQLGIVTLKKLVALICCHQSLCCQRNFGLLTYLVPTTNNAGVAYIGIPKIFPLFQLLIGLESENAIDDFSFKEFCAFEMARELGIFDDFTSIEYEDENIVEKQKQMILSFLYFSLLLVIERTLFNYNGYYFMEEQIIFALKRGISSLDELSEMYCIDAARLGRDQQDFNKILTKVSTNRRNNNNSNDNDKSGSSERLDNQNACFVLKEGIEWKPLSAINPFNEQATILNNIISKHPDELIKIPDFEDEETFFFHLSHEVKPSAEEENEAEIDSSGLNIRLKEFLSTPTVLAVIYHTLRTSGDKIELNDHLALNILILISKFAKDDTNNCSFNQVTSIHYNSKIADLISQFKTVLFNYKLNENRRATITNTLNKNTFKNFLGLKIGSDSLEPKSIIDILVDKGELGKSVLKQMSVDYEEKDSQNQKNAQNALNKQRASKIKENILNHYKNIITNYSTNELDVNDDEKAESQAGDDVCSVCSSATSKEQILCYPLYIYRTKFPFVVDKPPLVSVIEGSEFGVDEDVENQDRHADE